jgi:hypothetical protein
LGATNTENTTQNRSHGGEPDKMTLCSYNIASQIFKVPRRKKTKKKQKKKAEGEDRDFLLFFSLFEGKDSIENGKTNEKKKGRPKENWEKKKNRPHNLRVEQREDKVFRPTRAHI